MHFNPEKHPHVQALRNRMWQSSLGAPQLSIRIEGDIPAASGLGSSAALSVAAGAALRTGRGRWFASTGDNQNPETWAEGFASALDSNQLYTEATAEIDSQLKGVIPSTFIASKDVVSIDECALLAHSVEAIAQGGRASPMDSSTSAHGGIVLLSDQVEQDVEYLYTRKLTIADAERVWHLHSIELPPAANEVYLVIGNTGVYAPTAQQVAKVAELLETEPMRMKEIETIGLIARRGIQSLLDGEYGRLEPFHQRQTLSHRLVQYHGQMRMPVLKGPGHKALRPVNGLHYILVTATRRESPILIQQEVSLVSYATVIYQPSVCDSPRSGVHTNPL